MRKYVIYHASLTDDSSALTPLRKHAENGDIVGEYYDDLSHSEEQPQLKEAIAECKRTGATLLINNLPVIQTVEEIEREGVQVKRLM